MEAEFTIDLAVPEDAGVTERDALWFAYGIGDRGRVGARSVGVAEPPTETDVVAMSLPAARGGRRAMLPFNNTELLEQTRYPDGRIATVPAGPGALEHALITAFGVQRREPENPFNDHRGYPSARSKFPVHAFVNDYGHRRVLDVYQHALIDLGEPDHAGSRREVVLAGRYTRLSDVYKWFRGSLVNIELGINLRSLCVGMQLFGLSGRLRLPDAESRDVLVEFGLSPTWEWSLPLTVELDPADGGAVARTRQRPPPDRDRTPETEVSEPILAEVVAMNRALAVDASSDPVGPAIPALADEPGRHELSWAELLWRRSSGRVPRGLFGMNGRLRPLPAHVLRDAVAWLAVPPPGRALTDVYRAIKATVVIQAIETYADGIYDVVDGELVVRAEAPNLAAGLQDHYGYPLSPGVACDIRHASMIWFLSIRPRDLMTRFGPGAWNTAQYACGWISQGLSLAAASGNLYARPVRAFKETPAQSILLLERDEMIVLAVVTGTPRYDGGVLLDMRL